MRIVIAPDSFKGSIGAAAAAAALADGWLEARPGDHVTRFPLADGGEGTLEVLAAAAQGGRWHPAEVTGPAGARVASCWLELPGQTHVIELARASGLPLLAHPEPLRAHTTGTGELIGRALDAGARRIVIALGGSASTDGGTGALTALGACFLDATGQQLPRGGAALAGLASADLSGLRPAPPGGAACLTDVRAPLLGPAGAAAVFGPQKGASAAQIELLEAGLSRLAAVLGGQGAAGAAGQAGAGTAGAGAAGAGAAGAGAAGAGAAGAGAAGGTAYGFAAAWGASITPGAAELCRIAGLDRALAGADLVITGEGNYDRTSADGKVAGAVFAAAEQAGVRAVLVAGVIAADPPSLVVRSVALAGLAGGAEAAQQSPARWLRVAGRELALDLA